jgi:hypothetical protein
MNRINYFFLIFSSWEQIGVPLAVTITKFCILPHSLFVWFLMILRINTGRNLYIQFRWTAPSKGQRSKHVVDQRSFRLFNCWITNGKKQLGKHRTRYDDNNKVDLKVIVWEYVLAAFMKATIGTVTGFVNKVMKPDSIKVANFLSR